MLVFGGSRTFHRIACAIEDAGFEIRDTIMWLYGSGFPKSMDISKQIDKRGGKSTSWFGEYLKNVLKERNMTQSDLSKHFLSKNGGITGCVHNWVEGKNMPTVKQFNKICEILDLPFEKMKEAEREVIGKKEYTDNKNIMSVSNYNGERIHLDITIPSTDLAKQWDGWGTNLKPSFEPIIVARKPLKDSLVNNIIENGVGGINIDECRVELNGDKKTRSGCKTREDNISHLKFRANQVNKEDNSKGRFPSNTILTYDDSDFDEVCGGLGDEGSASRYFYCAKTSKRDRNEGLSSNNKNIHPTVKPTSLMQYLIRLVTPKGGTVLDPFNGSGSTGKACMYENADRNANYKYIGVELTEEYLPISKARIEFAEKNPIMDYDKKTKIKTEINNVESKNIFDL